jgi:hypothetical protein
MFACSSEQAADQLVEDAAEDPDETKSMPVPSHALGLAFEGSDEFDIHAPWATTRKSGSVVRTHARTHITYCTRV